MSADRTFGKVIAHGTEAAAQADNTHWQLRRNDGLSTFSIHILSSHFSVGDAHDFPAGTLCKAYVENNRVWAGYSDAAFAINIWYQSKDTVS